MSPGQRATPCCLCILRSLTSIPLAPYIVEPTCLCLALVTASDEEEGAGLFDSAGKAAADPFDASSGSVQLIAIKPAALPVVHPASDRGQESSAALNGEVSTHPRPGWRVRLDHGDSVIPRQVGCSLCPVASICTSAHARPRKSSTVRLCTAFPHLQ